MKKLTLTGAFAAAIMLMTACSEDNTMTQQPTADGFTTFSLTVPAEIASRSSLDDGSNATELYYAIYKAGTTDPVIVSGEDGYEIGTFAPGSNTTTISVKLMTNEKYTAVFWAQSHFESDDIFAKPFLFSPRDNDEYALKAGDIWVNYDTSWGYNSSDYDAFYGKADIYGGQSANVTLTRPFAQINLGASDYDDPAVDGANKDIKTIINVNKVPCILNLVSGETSESSSLHITDDEKAVSPLEETFPGNKDCKWLASCYVLAPKDGALVDVEYYLYNGTKFVTRNSNLKNIPVKANARTNISGELFLQSSDVNVTIFPSMGAPYEEAIEAQAPTEESDGTFSVSTPEQIKGLIEAVSGGETYEGKTITISSDIDLSGKKIPTAKNYKAFAGTIEGGHNTIKGISEPLFSEFKGLLKNIILEADNANGSAFAMKLTSGTSTFENVTINGSVVSPEGNAAALASEGSGTVELKNCINNASILANNTAAGLIVSSGKMTISNCKNTGSVVSISRSAGGISTGSRTDGCSVTGCINEGDVTGVYSVGGIVADLGGQNLNLSDCSNSGTVKMVVKKGSYSTSNYIGGICAWIASCSNSTPYTVNNLTNTGAIIVDTSNLGPDQYCGIGGVIGRYETAEWAQRATLKQLTNDAPITIIGNTEGAQKNIKASGLVYDFYLMAAGQDWEVTLSDCVIGDKTVISSTNPGITVAPYAASAMPCVQNNRYRDQTITVTNATNNSGYDLLPPTEVIGN